MNYDREKRYLEAQRLIAIFFVMAFVGLAAMTGIKACASDTVQVREQYDAPSLRAAAERCYQEGLRAILHSDGSIECRP